QSEPFSMDCLPVKPAPKVARACFVPNRQTQNLLALRSLYPASDGSTAILRSMPTNSRLSASRTPDALAVRHALAARVRQGAPPTHRLLSASVSRHQPRAAASRSLYLFARVGRPTVEFADHAPGPRELASELR